VTDLALSALDTHALPDPQPVGIFPLPAGYLLLGPGEAEDALRTDLLAGRLPADLPEPLRFYGLAVDGDLDGALDALPDPGPGELVDRINRLVLAPDAQSFATLVADTEDLPDRRWHAHVRLIGFTTGLTDRPPDTSGLAGEFAALAHAAQATAALEAHDRARAADELEAAAQAAHPVSRPMAGQLLGQLANVQLDDGGVQRATVSFQAALDALEGTDLAVSRAELHVAAGAMFQEMSEAAPRLMQQAINHYHQALALVTADAAPETAAIANANLGLAYLTMPMTEASDQLRMGVAVQSMREALEYFSPTNHPDRWSSTQLNLANALVYLPSRHQADNIAEAIGLYEGVLQHRPAEADPLGRARVLANQGNALAHLGVFDDARAKLVEARQLFIRFDEPEAASAVADLMADLDRHTDSLTDPTDSSARNGDARP
jgi:tetratricopeptide (TPR) repeat protein